MAGDNLAFIKDQHSWRLRDFIVFEEFICLPAATVLFIEPIDNIIVFHVDDPTGHYATGTRLSGKGSEIDDYVFIVVFVFFDLVVHT